MDPYSGRLGRNAYQNENVANKFDSWVNQEIDTYLNENYKDENTNQSSLESPQAKRAREKANLQKEAENPKLEKLVTKALVLLKSEGSVFLENEDYNSLFSNLSEAFAILESQEIQLDPNQTFQEMLSLSQSSMESMVKIAKSIFLEKRYEDCLCLYQFLNLLDPNNADYLYHAGIAAQRVGNLELALQAYEAAAHLDEGFIGATIFSIECHLMLKQKSEAEHAFQRAQDILKDSPSNETTENWKHLLAKYNMNFL